MEQVNSCATICCLQIYINDLEDDISSKVLKFADDTKIFRKVTNDTDKQSLQDDPEKFAKKQGQVYPMSYVFWKKLQSG